MGKMIEDLFKPADKGWISLRKLRREGQIYRREEGKHNSDEEAEYHGFLSRLRRKIARIEVYKGCE